MKIKQAKGFSLIELMIVIAILGIVLAIAAPQFTAWRDNQNLREAARDLSSDISLYRQRAIAENIHYQIVFNQAANNYTVQRETVLNSGVYNLLIVTKSPRAISSQVIISDNPLPSFSGGVPNITIQPRGTMSGGAVTLRHNTRGSKAKITLVQYTGRAPRIEYTLL